MKIIIDDLRGTEIRALLAEHLHWMAVVSPPESRHALDIDGLQQPDVTFWSLWDEDRLAGCGALKMLDDRHGEIKSMRTAESYLRRGIGESMLRHILAVARERKLERLSLETGSMDYFEPARRLYRKFGFQDCEPFAGYREDPNSVFMTRPL